MGEYRLENVAPFSKGNKVITRLAPNYVLEVTDCKFIKNPNKGIEPYWRVYAVGSGKNVEGNASNFSLSN